MISFRPLAQFEVGGRLAAGCARQVGSQFHSFRSDALVITNHGCSENANLKICSKVEECCLASIRAKLMSIAMSDGSQSDSSVPADR